MTVNEQLKEAMRLKQNGWSLRDIASELGTSKSTIDRWLKSHDITEDEIDQEENSPGTLNNLSGTGNRATAGQLMSEFEYELGKLKLLNNHVEVMADKKIKEKELVLMEQEQKLKEQKQVLKERKVEIEQDKKFEKLTRKQEKIEAQKQIFLNRFKKLVAELRDTCQDYTWDIEEVELYLDKTTRLKENVEVFCEKQFIDFKELEIWDSLDWIIDILESELDEYDDKFIKKGTIDFDFDDDEFEILEESLTITSFEELCNTEDEDEDEDYLDEHEIN